MDTYTPFCSDTIFKWFCGVNLTCAQSHDLYKSRAVTPCMSIFIKQYFDIDTTLSPCNLDPDPR